MIDASHHVEYYDVELGMEPFRAGIHTLEQMRSEDPPEKFLPVLDERYSALMDEGRMICMLGGEHSITLAALRAHLKAHPDLSVLHIDAHADMMDEYQGTRLGHGCFMRRAAEEGAKIVQAGIRSMDVTEADFIRENGIACFPMHEWRGREGLAEKILEQLGEKVYVTLDMDAFDTGLAPGVGTPVPGGFDWYAVLEIVRRVCDARNVVAFDVVETRPLPDSAATEFAAAMLAYKITGYLMNSPMKQVAAITV